MSEIKNESGKEGEIDIELKDKEIDIDDEGEDKGDKGDDKGDKKPIVTETPEARVARLQRQLKRAQKDAGVEIDEAPKKKTSKESGELDYGQKAFLVANGIKGSEETNLVKEVMSATGKSLDEVLESRHFQAELKGLREDKATKDAIPPGSKRSGQSQANEVEYWIAKGELPPADQRELRTKVVNARIKIQKDKNIFTDQPVAGK